IGPGLVAAAAELLGQQRRAGGTGVLPQHDLRIPELGGIGVELRVDVRRRELALHRRRLVALPELVPAGGARRPVDADARPRAPDDRPAEPLLADPPALPFR